MGGVFIYGLTDNLTNQVRYIGKTVNISRRLRKHISERFLHNSYKDRWIRKVIDNGGRIDIFIIDVVNKEEWIFWEQHYISYFRYIGANLTNGTIGGDEPPSTKNRKHTEESKLKMSQTKKGKDIPWLNNGKVRSLSHRNNLSLSLKGRQSPNKGKKFSEEYKNKLSDSHSHQKKAIVQMDLDGTIVKIWDSISKAKKFYKNNHIGECCAGKIKTAAKFIWKYKD